MSLILSKRDVALVVNEDLVSSEGTGEAATKPNEESNMKQRRQNRAENILLFSH